MTEGRLVLDSSSNTYKYIAGTPKETNGAELLESGLERTKLTDYERFTLNLSYNLDFKD